MYNLSLSEPCIIKILLGLLRYSSKLHRKKSRNSSSFSEKCQDARKSIEKGESGDSSKQLEDKECNTSEPQECGKGNATDGCEIKGSNSSGDLKGPSAEAEKVGGTHNSVGGMC